MILLVLIRVLVNFQIGSQEAGQLMTFIVTEGARQTCNHRVVGGQRLLIELLLVDFTRAHDVDQLRVKPVGVLVWLLLR